MTEETKIKFKHNNIGKTFNPTESTMLLDSGEPFVYTAKSGEKTTQLLYVGDGEKTINNSLAINSIENYHFVKPEVDTGTKGETTVSIAIADALNKKAENSFTIPRTDVIEALIKNEKGTPIENKLIWISATNPDADPTSDTCRFKNTNINSTVRRLHYEGDTLIVKTPEDIFSDITKDPELAPNSILTCSKVYLNDNNIWTYEWKITYTVPIIAASDPATADGTGSYNYEIATYIYDIGKQVNTTSLTVPRPHRIDTGNPIRDEEKDGIYKSTGTSAHIGDLNMTAEYKDLMLIDEGQEGQQEWFSASDYTDSKISSLKSAATVIQQVSLETLTAFWYPVGTVYSTTTGASPAAFLGGTWDSIGAQTIGSTTVNFYRRTA